jgi:hypothetical protein
LLVGKYLGVSLFVAIQVSLFVFGTWAALGLRTTVWHPTYLLAIPLLLVQFCALYGFSVLLSVFFRSTVVCVLGTIACWIACLGVNVAYHRILAAPLEAKAQIEAVAKARKKAEEEALKAPLQKPDVDLFKPPVGDEAFRKKPTESKEKKPQPKSDEKKVDPASLPAWQKTEIPDPFPEAEVSPALATVVKATYWILPKPADIGFYVFEKLQANRFVGPPVYYSTLMDANLLHLQWSLVTSVPFGLFMLYASVQQFQGTDY